MIGLPAGPGREVPAVVVASPRHHINFTEPKGSVAWPESRMMCRSCTMRFRHESGTIPARESMVRDSEDKVDPSKATRIVRGDITRSVQASLAMAPEVAIRLGNWLVTQGEAATAHRAKNKP